MNVRRMVKDGSILTASEPSSVSRLHTSAVLEPLSVTPFQIIEDDVNGDSCLSEEGEFNGYVKYDWQARGGAIYMSWYPFTL